jgi:hypothetical protein
LCERLFKGESFYNIEERTLTYSKQKGKFVAYNRDGESYNPDMNVWFKGDIYTKPHWTDNLSKENPVYCYLWNESSKSRIIKDDVIRADRDGYLTAFGDKLQYAEPVKLEDACIWEGE